ncbi:MAG: hypothetical protein HYY28_01640 [Betaproteobacteria bacterium]|nr:hypothetical protein [Betaproteobacteria bacterium]MBI2958990.1 hypothetical protein [Betaproteobacteria bacterium]
MDESVRWSLKVSRQTDEALRAYLGHVGGRKGDLSRFIEEAVRQRLRSALQPRQGRRQAAPLRARKDFADAIKEVRERARALTRAQVEKLAREAVAYARKRR